MTLSDELKEYVENTLEEQWSRRDGQKVPDDDDLKLSNDAVDLDATVLYADLADSTGLVKGYKDRFAAKIYKTYLYCASKVIRSHDGVITAFDGDRVMAVFIGKSKNTDAANVALKINWVVTKVIQPAMQAQYPKTSFVLRQKVGIDTSEVMVAKTGIRGSNDLVWVGESANNAAKLAALSTDYSSYISSSVFDMLNESAKFGKKEKKPLWTDLGSDDLGFQVYGSTWRRSL